MIFGEDFGAITGAAALALSLGLAAREVVGARKRAVRLQAEQVSVTAEFIGWEGYNPVVRIVCHNRSDHAVTDVTAYIVWDGVTDLPEVGVGLSQCVDLIGFHGVAPGERADRTATLIGNLVEEPYVIPGPFPVRFTLTDASSVRWDRRLDGKLRKNPVEILGHRLSDESVPRRLRLFRRRIDPRA